MSGTVVDALTYWARSKPDLPAIDFAGDVVTYAELSTWADGVAHDLASRGVTRATESPSSASTVSNGPWLRSPP